MSCFPCFSSGEKKEVKRRNSSKEASVSPERNGVATPPPVQEKPDNHHKPVKQADKTEEKKDSDNGNIQARTFTFRELAAATNNFRPENLLGEGGFGRVYKGNIDNDSQAVAVKQLDRNGLQGNKEFLVEVLMLSLLHHENLVNLIGYCADGDQRLLVYEFMPLGSLEEHLFDIGPDKEPLDWNTRMRIATGAAKGLEYLHDKANPPVIYRDLKSSNILLEKGFNPKLSDFGLAKLGPVGDKTHVSSRVMGTYGYCAPEYARSGQLTLKSDVYSFGVVLLELITGRSAIDTTRPPEEQNLVAWAQPYFKNPKRFPELADPRLQGNLQTRSLNQAVAVAAMCLQEEATVRPLVADVVAALSFLSMDAGVTSTPVPTSVALSPPPEERMLSDVPSPEEKMLSDDPPAGEETSSDDDSHKNEKNSNHDPFSEPEATNDDDQSQDEEGTETIQLGSHEEAAIAEAIGSDSDSDSDSKETA